MQRSKHHVETIQPTRCHPNYVPSFSTHIGTSKDTALGDVRAVHEKASVAVYCDGSGYEGGVGASAVLYTDGAEVASLKYHLGTMSEHTVYEGKAVGLTLGLHLLTSLSRQLHGLIIFCSDSQAVIKGLGNQRPIPSHYLLDRVHEAAKALQARQDCLQWARKHRLNRGPGSPFVPRTKGVVRLQLHWSPDTLAKDAAQGHSSDPKSLPTYLRAKTLPCSISAFRQADIVALQVRWKHRWKRSPRFAATRRLDSTLPSRNYLRLIRFTNRCHSALLTQLRTNHLPLNQHLFRIHRSETPVCPYCGGIMVESVRHFVLECPQYCHEHFIHLTRPLKQRAESLAFLLLSSVALSHLLRYVDATKRFRPTSTPAGQASS